MASPPLSHQVLQEYLQSSRLEWLSVNSFGAYAMGSAANSNTRRYHGLLVAPLPTTGERAVLLSRVEEQLLVDGHWVELGSCQYPGIVQPAGHRFLQSFLAKPYPLWHWQVNSLSLHRRLDLLARPHRVNLTYLANQPVALRWRPFFALRPYHHLRDGEGFLPAWGHQEHLTVVSEQLAAKLHLRAPAASWHEDAHWYHQVEYLEELDRGFPFRESLFSPGYFSLTLSPNEPWAVAVALDGDPSPRPFSLAPPPALSLVQQLDLAAQDFLFTRSDGEPSLLAGFPWFTDWGRDTMISLPGLLLSSGKTAPAKAILEGFLRYEANGLLPNRFPDGLGPPEYNTADATLWAFSVAHQLFALGESDWVLHSFLPVARKILNAHLQGTLFSIAADPDDGLLRAGTPDTQLTWMDARCHGLPVTPRNGKAVELNALWANAWFRMEQFCRAAGLTSEADSAAARFAQIQTSFRRTFWLPHAGYCQDLENDASLRPNQLLAVSLGVPLLAPAEAQQLLSVVHQHLLTPAGLRTLAPGSPGYTPQYFGSPESRDRAYHQGTVWPWLWEPFWRAWLANQSRSSTTLASTARISGPSPDPLRQVAAQFPAQVEALLHAKCLGQLPEICDAEAPHTPRGAPAQAWSVAAARSLLTLLEKA